MTTTTRAESASTRVVKTGGLVPPHHRGSRRRAASEVCGRGAADPGDYRPKSQAAVRVDADATRRLSPRATAGARDT